MVVTTNDTILEFNHCSVPTPATKKFTIFKEHPTYIMQFILQQLNVSLSPLNIGIHLYCLAISIIRYHFAFAFEGSYFLIQLRDHIFLVLHLKQKLFVSPQQFCIGFFPLAGLLRCTRRPPSAQFSQQALFFFF